MKIDQKWQIMAIICAGIFISTLDGSILTIANPIIADTLQISINSVQWVTTAYMLVITATLLLFGKIGDQFDNGKIFALGFLVFSAGSLCCSLSPGLAFLIGSRIFQGFGSSMMMATGMGIISDNFAPGEKGKALGLTGSMVGIGNMTGPVLGGVLLAHFGWHSIFLVNVPIGCLGCYLAWRYLPVQTRTAKPLAFDLPGILFFAAGTVTLILALSRGAGIHWPGAGIGCLLILIFYFYEKKSLHPLLDFKLMELKPFLFGNILAFIAQASQISVMFLIPFFLVNGLDYSPAMVGLCMTIPPIGLAITAPLAGSLSDKIGSGRLVSAGLLLMTLSHVTLSTLGSGYDMARIITALILIGTGMGCFGSPNSSSIFSAIPQEKSGYTGGFTATVRNLALSLGIALSATLFSFFLLQQNSTTPLAYTSALRLVYHFTGGMTLCGLLISVLQTRNARTQAQTNQRTL